MENIIAENLNYASLPGLSEKLLSEHHDVLYAGYVKKLNEIRTKLATADLTEANASYSLIGELKREETFTANAVRLHEVYFDSMGDNTVNGAMASMIERDFGSIDQWKREMMASGISARGWVVTAYDRQASRLFNYSCDAHNLGCIWDCIPLVVLDVYEHAYYLDYATGRKAYIDAFFANLSFAHANKVIGETGLS